MGQFKKGNTVRKGMGPTPGSFKKGHTVRKGMGPTSGSFKKGHTLSVGEKNPRWKGGGYRWLHYWVNKNLPKPEFCEECKTRPPYDASNISGEYRRDLSDYRWLCRSCHWKYDNR